MVSVYDSWPGGCEFDTQLRQTFFPAYFCHSPLKHVRKVVGTFGKKVVLVLVRECQENHHMTLAVNMALNPNTINQSKVSPFCKRSE